jgi:hypothetical protein
MENVSKKRGRPALYDDLNSRAVAEIAIEGPATERTKQNAIQWIRGFSVIRDANDPAFSWIVDMTARPEIFRKTILTELGRWYTESGGGDSGAAAALHGARIISEIDPRPTAKHAAAMLRTLRTGGDLAGNADGLEDAIFAAITDYTGRYPGIENDTIHKALRSVLSAWEDAALVPGNW